jgi:phosphoheptose isomerase
MSELDEPLPARFADHVDTVYRTLDGLQPQLERAVEELADTLLAERRVIACGLGTGACLAQVFAAGLLGRMRLERPGLPVMVLGNDAPVLGAVVEAYGQGSVLARPLQALLHRGDAVLLVCGAAPAALAAAARAAQSCEARVIALSGEGGANAGPLARGDIDLRIPSDDPARIAECQLLLLNCLAELLEQRLFGAA